MTARVVHVNDNVPDAVYIGRAVPRRGLKASKWANPFRIGRDGDRDKVIRLYVYHLDHHMTPLTETLREIAGKPLACWCRRDGEDRTDANACHGDVLIALIRELGLEDAP